MFARVHKLRTLGALETCAPPPHGDWAQGILEFSSAVGDGERFGPRRLILRNHRSDPTRGVIFELYRAELVDIGRPHLRLRGIEPVSLGSGSTSAMVQDWLVLIDGGSRA